MGIRAIGDRRRGCTSTWPATMCKSGHLVGRLLQLLRWVAMRHTNGKPYAHVVVPMRLLLTVFHHKPRRTLLLSQFHGGKYVFRNHRAANYANETISGRFSKQVHLTEQKFKTPSFRLHPSHFQHGPVGPHLKRLGRPSPTIRDPVSLGDTIPRKREPISNWGISHSTACLS